MLFVRSQLIYSTMFLPFAETEQVSLSHLQLAHNMKEEAKKLEDFRENQKEMRKKVDGFISTVMTCPQHFATC